MPFDRETVQALAEWYDSFYLYDEREILRRTEALRGAFPSVTFLYSAKANPHPLVLRAVLSRGFGLDAASPAEVRMGVEQGLSPEQIHFSAPGKTDAGLEQALGRATVIADSVNEVERIQRLAARRGQKVRIGLRIHPAFAMGGERVQPSKFGIDEREALALLPRWNVWENVAITGIHIHLKSQILDWTLLADYYRQGFALARRMSCALGRSLDFVNLGSGIGIPYARGEEALALPALGETLEALCAAFRESHPRTSVLLETGRYVVGPAGVYGTKVLDRKVSCGKTFVILSNTLNGFLRPSLARLVEREDTGTPVPCEPLYTGRNAIQALPITDNRETETVTLVGNLCTMADVAAEEICLPRLDVGDLVLFLNAGSYAAVLSPMQFSSQVPPVQRFLSRTGELLE